MRIITVFFLLLFVFQSKAQTPCNIEGSTYNQDVLAVDVKDVYCIAKNSDKNKTLIFTYGAWCAPCIAHLPGAIKLSKDYNLDLFILLLDDEANHYIAKAVEMIKAADSNAQIMVLKDAVYSKKRGRRNKEFLTAITPPEFENIDDYSKYILLDNNGKVLMVTSYKDYEGDHWKDDSGIQKRRIIPLL